MDAWSIPSTGTYLERLIQHAEATVNHLKEYIRLQFLPSTQRGLLLQQLNLDLTGQSRM